MPSSRPPRRCGAARGVEPRRAGAGTRWLSVRPFDGAIATVGPLVVPGESACYECLLLRLAGHLDYGGRLAPDRGDGRRRPGGGPARGASPPARPRSSSSAGSPGTTPALPGLLHVLETRPAALAHQPTPCCGCRAAPPARPPSASLRLSRGTRPPRDRRRSSRPGLRRAVSPYTGIVRALEECLAAPRSRRSSRRPARSGRRRACSARPLGHLRRDRRAPGLTRAEAAAAAVGEALERYSATFVPHERLVVATARELGGVPSSPSGSRSSPSAQHRGSRVPVPAVHRRHARRLGRRRVASGAAASVCCRPSSCSSGRSRIAGQRPDRLRDEQRPRLRRERSRTRSSTRLCELLERDAFMIVWANRLSLPLLDWADADRRGSTVAASRRAGLRYAAVDLSVVPPAPVGARRRAGAGAARRARSASVPARGPTLERAWWKALAEAFACRAAGAKLALLDAGRRPSARGASVVRGPHPLLRRRTSTPRRTAFLDASAARTAAARCRRSRARRPRIGSRRSAARVEAAGSTRLRRRRHVARRRRARPHGRQGRRAGALRARRPARRALPRRPAPLRGRGARSGCGRGPRRGRRQPRPAPVPVTRVAPTAQFASLVYGPGGVALDDPAEALHEASRLYPNVAPRGLEVLLELAAGSELSRSTIARAEPHARSPPAADLPPPGPLRGQARATLLDAPAVAARPRSLGPSRCDDLAPRCSRPRTRSRRGAAPRRPVPSGGALYPLELYVARRSPSTALEPGVYHYNPFRHRLALLAPLDVAAAARGARRPAARRHVAAPRRRDGALLALAVQVRPRAATASRCSRQAIVAQNALLAATDLGLPALPLGGFYDRRLDDARRRRRPRRGYRSTRSLLGGSR